MPSAQRGEPHRIMFSPVRGSLAATQRYPGDAVVDAVDLDGLAELRCSCGWAAEGSGRGDLRRLITEHRAAARG